MAVNVVDDATSLTGTGDVLAFLAELGQTFRTRSARKIYWAIVAGVPKVRQGRISTFLAKDAAAEAMVSMTEFSLSPVTVGTSGSLMVMNEGTVPHNLVVEDTDQHVRVQDAAIRHARSPERRSSRYPFG